MNNGYLDKSLVQNSLLACTLLTLFIKKYDNLNSYTDNVDLLKLLLVLPIVWHKESCNLICKRKTTTSLNQIVAENSLIKANFEKRILEFSPIAIQGLNLAKSTKLISIINYPDKTLFRINFKRWPSNYDYKQVPKEMLNTINRLAYWFRNYSTEELYFILMGK
ncbi:three component ABC system middle component [Acinetobacter baumannii]|uniref:three component ABC system middle component n=1 Tax=Acinetobacter baumannii TaxID=470 RepID=UPI001DB02B92|nr:three component ABC system middle component [Acinetobacter baumannii]EHU1704558.1 hypothetical protein [Acinetobacter baumannii]MDC4735160.1 DUF6521 family protein [Acinetobacter baumannii]MDH2601288.1 DUF6521 family protein [Acinetobacter baumannii]MDI7714307.1 DUF6521 family protein [Acinetobacter baumannii]MDO7475517.1 DUF6521 family protein [Acinetobacter baumannii]